MYKLSATHKHPHPYTLARIYFDSSGCVYLCVHNWCFCVCGDTTRLWKAAVSNFLFLTITVQCASAYVYLYIIHPRKIQLVMNNMTVLCAVCVFKDGKFSGFFMNALKLFAKLFTRTRTRSLCLIATQWCWLVRTAACV